MLYNQAQILVVFRLVVKESVWEVRLLAPGHRGMIRGACIYIYILDYLYFIVKNQKQTADSDANARRNHKGL